MSGEGRNNPGMADPSMIDVINRRQRLAGTVGSLLLLVVVMAAMRVDDATPALSGLYVATLLIGIITILVLVVRAYRCIKCGRGLKLGGHTCSGCGVRY